MVRGNVMAAVAAAVLAAPLVVTAAAQDKPKEQAEATIPASAMPPEGMCRVWLKDVPERQQPAPTDCATAVRNRPRNASVIFGDLAHEAKQPPQRLAPAGGTVGVGLRGGSFDESAGRRGFGNGPQGNASQQASGGRAPQQGASGQEKAAPKSAPAASATAKPPETKPITKTP